MEFAYKIRKTRERLGTIELELETLADLNQAIDLLFEHLETEGRPSDLELLAPYFGVVWASGRALAEYLAAGHAGDLAGRSMLEVGCGLALPSLVAAERGARVTAVDSHPDVPRFLARNIALNRTSNADAGLKFVSVDWSRASDGSRGDEGLGLFELVVASDVLYERSHAPDVARALARHIAPGGEVLLADPGRPYLQEFVDALEKEGFSCETRILATADGPADAGQGGTPPEPREIFLVIGRRPS